MTQSGCHQRPIKEMGVPFRFPFRLMLLYLRVPHAVFET